MSTTPYARMTAEQRENTCHMCGHGPHPTTSHAFWSEADIDRWGARQPSGTPGPMTVDGHAHSYTL